MARFFTPQTIGNLDGTTPPVRQAPGLMHAKLRIIPARIDLAQVGATITTADEVVLGKEYDGYRFAFGIMNASVTMGASAQLAVGTSPTHASNGQYRAAAVFTTVNTPTLFGLAAAQQANPPAAERLVFLTVGAANLPTSGLLNIDLYYSYVG
ncbi:MAG: hypothetical protein MUE77_06500 [Sandarakinorhabdus sp.]|jgi:hypothetical protein|nr:hypothetical protein [Sandarakinorhabdus sp.]